MSQIGKGERIAKHLARAGLCSRRDAERMIAEGRVAVDDNTLETPAFFVTSENQVTVDGKPIGAAKPQELWRYHKSPGLITSGDHIEPASYANFAITSHLVVVPTFGSPHDEDGVAAIAELFPDRATIGLPGDAVLAGGGGFHCASQQMPSARWRP